MKKKWKNIRTVCEKLPNAAVFENFFLSGVYNKNENKFHLSAKKYIKKQLL